MVRSTVYLENCTVIPSAFGESIISNVDLKLSKTVFLRNMTQSAADIRILKINETNYTERLYTYECEFIHGNRTLKSSVKNFKQIAIKEDFLHKINFYNQRNFETEETQYASSKPLY